MFFTKVRFFMFYKNSNNELTDEFFLSPTSEYKGMPFWAWGFNLDNNELSYQIEVFKDMGFGGAVAHPRAGLDVEYLSDEFMSHIKYATEKMKTEDMFVILYDEDRWPSGFAGGFVPRNPEFRQRAIKITKQVEDCCDFEVAIKNGGKYLVAVFDINFNSENEILDYKKIDTDGEAEGEKYFVYCFCTPKMNRFNGESYIDTLNPKAVQCFIELTYDNYLNSVGNEFDKTVKAIFTDEPQYARKHMVGGQFDIQLTWTPDFPKTFIAEYGYDIVDNIPELFWDLSNGRKSKARYQYHNHTADRITNGYLKTCSDWCKNHGLFLTGHMVEETSMFSQTSSSGDVMRTYEYFDIPGIDMLCNNIEYVTAKQVQSVARQYGKEGIMSELYGVMGWDIDFLSHKLQGDWQAAMGITLRVHSVALGTLKGIAKRDFPASINYHSPWYKEYKTLEDHYSRLATVLTRGDSHPNTAVIHPIESYWLNFGPVDSTGDIREDMDKKLVELTDWLIHGQVDFDFINEHLLSKQNVSASDGKLCVEKMQYDTVIVPACITLRSTTVKYLCDFANSGGRIIFMGGVPQYVDGTLSNLDLKFNNSTVIDFSKEKLMPLLCPEIEIIGSNSEYLIHSLKHEKDAKWLFVAHDGRLQNNCNTADTQIIIKGNYEISIYDTISGKISPAYYFCNGDTTTVYCRLGAADSILLKLVESDIVSKKLLPNETEYCHLVTLNKKYNYQIENNVLLLDYAEYSLDDKPFENKTEILQIDYLLREKLGYPIIGVYDFQPWAVENENIDHTITLRFEFESKISTICEFAAEELSYLQLNGKAVVLEKTGFFVDHMIPKYRLGKIKKGRNNVVIKVPFNKKYTLENCYILGSFAVTSDGKKIIKAKNKISFGDISHYGMPFYVNNIVYNAEFSLKRDSDIELMIPKFNCAVIKVIIDGVDKGNIAYPPFKLKVDNLRAGKHKIDFVVYGNSGRAFGPLHYGVETTWNGPNLWYPTDSERTEKYVIKQYGILDNPVIFYK